MPAEFYQLKQARAEHDWDCEEESEFRRHETRSAKQDTSENRRAGTRGAGHEG